MEPTVPADPINALREKARGKTWAVCSPIEAPSVSPFDPRQSGQLSPDQMRGVEALGRTCALKMAEALGTLLCTSLEMSLVTIEQGSSGELLDRLANPSYLLSFQTTLGVCFMQIDLSVVFPFLDLILGGSGKEAIDTRDLTEIEQELLAPVNDALAHSLQESWRTLLKVDIGFEQRLQKSEATALLSSTAQLLLLNFEVRWQEKKGRLLLVLPAVVSTALLRSLVPQETVPQHAPPKDRGRLQEQLLDCKFEAELLLPRSTVSVRQLYRLAPGEVLVLQVRSSELLPVHVAGRHMFLASPARCGSQRGAQVQRVLSIVPDKEGEERK